MRNGQIERFDCYPALNLMLKQMGVPPDFASAVSDDVLAWSIRAGSHVAETRRTSCGPA
jgi:hypothetical protein